MVRLVHLRIHSERGPAPERSPVRARFDAEDGGANVSMLDVCHFLQVSDITAFGKIEEAAQVLLPRGSVVLAASSEVQQISARETPMGIVEIPPRTYYRCTSMANAFILNLGRRRIVM
jgi:hypothetical protein